MEDVIEITLADVVDLRNKLKKIDKYWAKNLACIINKKQSKIKFDETRVYNIVNGLSKHQTYRLLFIKFGQILYENKLSELENVKKLIAQ